MVEKADRELIDRIIRSTKIEVDDFIERANSGNLVSQDEWSIMRDDWNLSVKAAFQSILCNINDMKPDQMIDVKHLIDQIRSIKGKILEHGYAYPENIDQVDTNTLLKSA